MTGQPLTELLAQLGSLGDDDLLDVLAQVEVDLRAAQAARAAVVRAVHDRIEAMGYTVSGAAETLAATCVTSTRSAHYVMDASMAVCDRPTVWQALAEGQIDLARARLVAEGLMEVPDEFRDDLEQRALDYAAEHTAYESRRFITRLLVDLDPELDRSKRKRERKKAWEDRYLSVTPRENGMADLYGYLPMGTAHLLLESLDEVARSHSDDRTLDQKRVDALGEILAEKVHLDVNVDVVIPADTLAALQESGGSATDFGPVTGDYARYLALNEDARWRRLISDPATGTLSELSTSAYRIPEALKRGVRARDRFCRFPGCTAAADHTDTDHVLPWPTGPTDASNLIASCRTHHRMKTHSAWSCEMDEAGVVTWTSPLGSKHRTYPWDYLQPTG